MSVFKRLSNVAKGKIKEIGKNLGDMDPFGEMDPPEPPPPRSESAASEPPRSAPAEKDSKDILARLLDEGLLTQEEYDEKLAALEDGADSGPGSRKPMKRTL